MSFSQVVGKYISVFPVDRRLHSRHVESACCVRLRTVRWETYFIQTIETVKAINTVKACSLLLTCYSDDWTDVNTDCQLHGERDDCNAINCDGHLVDFWWISKLLSS